VPPSSPFTNGIIRSRLGGLCILRDYLDRGIFLYVFFFFFACSNGHQTFLTKTIYIYIYIFAV
jgi:hypothetical protein